MFSKNKASVFFALLLFNQTHLLFSQAIKKLDLQKQHTPVIPYQNLKSALLEDIPLSPYYSPIHNWEYAETINLDTNDIFNPLIINALPWKKTLNHVPNKTDWPQKFAIRYVFSIPGMWKGRETFFQVSIPNQLVTMVINGIPIGKSKFGNQVGEIDITPYIKNDLAEIIAFCTCLDSIKKSVPFNNGLLYSTPRLQIRDYKLVPVLDAANNGQLDIALEVRNLDRHDHYKYLIEFALYDPKGKLVFSDKSPLFSFSKSKIRTKGVTYKKKVINPVKWNFEVPTLYTFVITMWSDKEEILEILASKIGFSVYEQKFYGHYINNKVSKINAVVLSGILEGRPDYNIDSLQKKLLGLKYLNFNAVKFSDFKPTHNVLSRFDKMGMYTIKTIDSTHIPHPSGLLSDKFFDNSFVMDINSIGNKALDTLKWKNQFVAFGALHTDSFSISLKNNYETLVIKRYKLRWEFNDQMTQKKIKSGISDIDLQAGEKKSFFLPVSSKEIPKNLEMEFRAFLFPTLKGKDTVAKSRQMVFFKEK